IDVVMIGGNDLSTTMGIGGQTGDARMIEAFEQLTAACRKHGKWAGMGGVANNEHLQKFIAMGVRFVLAGADTGFLTAAASQRAKAIRDMDAPKG
ncbi:MAG: aldolase/citrate lyase family protein, partial [Proteobacteria bacterium]|nr:aldolase/citrate lyase family protein [Pseudomonadota bacterium]